VDTAPVRRRATIHEVAERAGVSVATVSRALGGYPDVAAPTRAAVREAAQALGYRPAAAARTIRLGRSGLVGAFLNHCDPAGENLQPIGRLVAASLAEHLAAEGLGVLSFERVDGLLDEMAARQLDAAVLVAISDRALEGVDLAAAPCPVIGVDTAAAIEVRGDHARGIELAVEHLAQLGHRRIGYAGAQTFTVAGRERLRGFRAAVARLGLDGDRRLEHEGDYSEGSGRAAAAALLALDPPPTAIVAVADMVAGGICAAAAERGLRVPDDLSVVGFDDLPFAEVMSPPLTTVRQDTDELGALAAQAVRAAFEDDTPRTILAAPALVVRGSTSRARSPATR
jgi:LacI family transcriptional regulator